MKSEFYVVNLVKSSEDACRRVAECLGFDGSQTRDTVLYQMSRRNVLWRFMTRFECNWRDIFEELRSVLDRDVNGPGLLGERDLQLLIDPRGQRLLSEILECTPGEAIQMLFSAKGLHDLLRETGVARRRDQLQDDAEWLLSVLFSESARPKLEHALGSVDLWALLYDLMIVPTRARLANKLGCPEVEALRTLIRRVKQADRLMKPAGKAAEFGSGTGLDSVALSKFRVYLHLYRYSAVEEAKSQAHRAKARLPGFRLPSMLPSLVEYYVSRDFRSAINNLLHGKEALRRICPWEIVGWLERAPVESPIDITVLPRDGNELVAGIHVPDDKGKRTEVLRLRGLDVARLEHIQVHLPRKAADLSQIGSTIAERLLNTMLPPFSAWKRSLRAAMANRADPDNVDDTFIQSLVLAGVSLRPHSPGLEFGQPPDVSPKPEMRVEFPVGAQGIADQLLGEFRRRGKDLRTVEIVLPEPPLAA